MPKVWIADDDDAIRMILDEHLKSEGLDVSSFSDGELLLNELDKDVPDLVISDIKMPGVNGYDLLKHLNMYQARNLNSILILIYHFNKVIL